jgi:hypothetical protein
MVSPVVTGILSQNLAAMQGEVNAAAPDEPDPAPSERLFG